MRLTKEILFSDFYSEKHTVFTHKICFLAKNLTITGKIGNS